MEETGKKERLPLFGMLLTTALVLGGLHALLWWTENRGPLYAQRADEAARQGNWTEAFRLAQQAEDFGEKDLVTAMAYRQAESVYDAGDYAAARELFLALEQYEDAPRRALGCTYRLAEAALEAGDLEAARDGFFAAAGYDDALARRDECRYALAERQVEAENMRDAFQAFLELGDFQDAAQRARTIACDLTGETDEQLALMLAQGYTAEDWAKQEQLMEARAALSNHRLAAGKAHAALLIDGGRVLSGGDNSFGQCDTADWAHVIAVSAGYRHTLALTDDGHALAAGDNSYGQCDVAGWTELIALCCGPWDSYGLRRNGTVLHTGFTALEGLEGWTDVISLGAGDGALLAVRQDGTLLSSLPLDAGSWRDLCAACPISRTAAALKADGTMLCKERDLSAWADVIALTNSSTLLVGLRQDGALLCEELLPGQEELQRALTAEQNVIGLSVAGTYALVLHADGTLSAPGAPEDIRAFCEKLNADHSFSR